MRQNILIISLILLTSAFAENSEEKPSFLFLLGDDIGWSDFSYNNGIANTPNLLKWVKT